LDALNCYGPIAAPTFEIADFDFPSSPKHSPPGPVGPAIRWSISLFPLAQCFLLCPFPGRYTQSALFPMWLWPMGLSTIFVTLTTRQIYPLRVFFVFCRDCFVGHGAALLRERPWAIATEALAPDGGFNCTLTSSLQEIFALLHIFRFLGRPSPILIELS